jgi:hypothetical protein
MQKGTRGHIISSSRGVAGLQLKGREWSAALEGASVHSMLSGMMCCTPHHASRVASRGCSVRLRDGARSVRTDAFRTARAHDSARGEGAHSTHPLHAKSARQMWLVITICGDLRQSWCKGNARVCGRGLLRHMSSAALLFRTGRGGGARRSNFGCTTPCRRGGGGGGGRVEGGIVTVPTACGGGVLVAACSGVCAGRGGGGAAAWEVPAEEVRN